MRVHVTGGAGFIGWHPESGALTELRNESNASLPDLARMLLELPTADLLDATMLRSIESVGPPRSK